MASQSTESSNDAPMLTATTAALLSQEQQELTWQKQRSPDTRRSVLKAIKRGTSVADAARTFKVHKRTIYLWKQQWATERTVIPKKKTGRKPKLSEAQVGALKTFVAKYPTASNARIKAGVDLSIHESNVSRYLKRDGFTRKKVSDEPTNWPDERVKQEIRDFLAAVEQIPDEKRVYMDESFAYTNEAPTHGRSEKGKRISRPRERHGKKLTFLLAVRKSGLVHQPWIIDRSANDATCVEYVRDHLVPHLQPGEVVIWDRLGRSGRAKNPVKQHYNPEIRKMIEEKGCRLLFLPPKGKQWVER
jgi:transposase